MKAFLWVSFIVMLVAGSAFEEEEGVIVLNDKNFNEVVKSFQMIMVAFYAPWCKHSKELMPEYVKAAAILKGIPQPVLLAKIDVVANANIAKEYQISRYPTIKLFLYQAIFEFGKARTTEEIVEYIKSKQKGAVERFTTVSEVEAFSSNATLPVLFTTMAEGDADYLLYRTVALKNERIRFAECSSAECKSRFQAPLTMLMNFDEREVIFPNEAITEQSINRFIELYSIELGGVFNDYAAEAIFDFNKTSLFYFRSESDPNRALNDALMKVIAKDFREKFYVFVLDITGNEIFELSAKYFYVSSDSLPQIQMINIEHEDEVKMYIMEEKTINEQSVRKFIQDYFDGKIAKEPKSEEIPEKIPEVQQMEKLVGRNFVKMAIENEKSFFVLMYVMGETKGRDLFFIWNELSGKYHTSEEVTYAGIDLSKNEVNGVSKDQIPLMRLYVKGDKQNPRDYTGNPTLINIEEWMAEQLGWTKPTTTSDSDKKADL